MAEENKQEEEEKQGSSMIMMAAAGVLLIALIAVGFFMMQSDGDEAQLNLEKPTAEYMVASKMYQLKDGSYLKLAFSMVVDEDQVETVRNIIEKESPGRLPAGITMILGNKAREDLISGTHKREAFARQLKKMLEERVFADYNKKQASSSDAIEVREVLISDFVTQAG